MSARLLLLNGPNLNLLGRREPQLYGATTLAQVDELCVAEAARWGATVVAKQSNSEGALVTAVQEAAASVDGVVINAGAYTHTSIALRDALVGVALPFVEVHISNVYARETFRHHSYLSDIASGVIVGLGVRGYPLAVRALCELLMDVGPPEG